MSTERETVERGYRLLARAYPWSATAGGDLERALAFCGWGVAAETVTAAGYGSAIIVTMPTVALLWLLGAPVLVSAGVGLALAVLVAHGVHALPHTVARLRRSSALGAAPALVGRAVMRMRVSPSPERAATFAARTTDEPLARSLAEHARRARATPGSGLGAFAETWAERFPALRRAALLVEAAGDAPPAERGRTLDRAMAAVLDGTRREMAAFAAAIRGPVTGVYAFGVLLPLALASVLPAAPVAGLPITVPAVAVAYDLLLPACLAVAAVRILARRPVAFRPPTVPSTHPALDGRRRRAILGAALAGGAGLAVASLLGIAWARVTTATGLAVGTGLLCWFRPEALVRDRTRALEAGLPDALYLVGRRVEEGAAVETAVAAVADEVAGPAGRVFAAAARRQRQLGLGVGTAFTGDHGPLVDLPSPRARGAVALLDLATGEGRPAGAAAVSLADHLEELRSVEADARTELSTVAGTLGTTAAVFAPMVGGVTVALGAAMGSLEGGAMLPVRGLGRSVGVYLMVVSPLLACLSTGLVSGLDRALLGYRVGGTLVSATTVYVAAFVGAGMVV